MDTEGNKEGITVNVNNIRSSSITNSNTAKNTTNDNSTAPDKRLPQTGENTLIIIAIVIALSGIGITYVKFKQNNY